MIISKKIETDLKKLGDIILTTTTYKMPKFIIKNRSETPSPVQEEERDAIMLEVEELPAAAAAPEPEPIVPQPRTLELSEIPPSYKPHPQYTEFLACEETGKIIWKKENGIKEKYATSRGYIQLCINGRVAYQKPQIQFIAEIFKPEPHTTVKMQNRAEKWVLKLTKEYDALKYEGYIPARFIEWKVEDESRRKTAKIQKARENFGIFNPLERATRDILRPANDGGAARRPSASSASIASTATAETDETDETDETYETDERFEKMRLELLNLQEQIDYLKEDRDLLLRRLSNAEDKIWDAYKDESKMLIKQLISVLNPEQSQSINAWCKSRNIHMELYIRK